MCVCVCLSACVKCERLRRGEVARSPKDKCRAKSAMSGGAPDLFE